jgi:transposase
MEGSALLSLPEGLCIMQVQEEATALTISVTSTRPCSYCPLCAQASSSVHSHYSRTVRDVPCGGHNVRLHLVVRKFFCRNPDCQRKIFTERLPNFVQPWAQMTLRLAAAIQAIGLATSGSLGVRLAGRLGIVTSWMTILRRIMALPLPAPGAVTALGIDDFCATRKVAYVAVRTRRMEDLTWGSAPSALPG